LVRNFELFIKQHESEESGKSLPALAGRNFELFIKQHESEESGKSLPALAGCLLVLRLFCLSERKTEV